MNLSKKSVDFAKNSSIHGIRYTVASSSSIFERIFWITVIIISLTFSIYMTTLFWGRYSENSTRIIIDNNNALANTVPFPAVTICNFNMILETKLEKFLKKLDYASEIELLIIKNVITDLKFTAKNKINFTELAIAKDVLEKNGFEEVKNIFKRVSQSCDELLVKCLWDQHPTECKTIFEETFTAQGRCCSFNYIGKTILKQAKFSNYYGASTGLKVQLEPDFNERNRAGVIVSVHNPKAFPGSDDDMKKGISLGSINYIEVNGLERKCSKEVKSLNVLHRQCLYSDERALGHFGEYTYANCLSLCEASTAINSCGCVPYYYDFLYEQESCRLADISCLKNISNDLSSNNCNCPAQCEDSYYNFVMTTTKFTNKSTKWMLKNTFRFNDNSILLNVFFSTKQQTVWVRDVITSITYLISSFGGIYCLFLGCSIISVVEIFYYFIGKFPIPNNEIQPERKLSKIFTIHHIGISRKIKKPVVPFIN